MTWIFYKPKFEWRLNNRCVGWSFLPIFDIQLRAERFICKDGKSRLASVDFWIVFSFLCFWSRPLKVGLLTKWFAVSEPF